MSMQILSSSTRVKEKFWNRLAASALAILTHGEILMRPMFTGIIVAIAYAGSSLAQPATNPEITNAPTVGATTAPAANPSASNQPSNPAIKTTEGNNSNTPVAGANSFTEGQAKSRIESMGYANVSGLTKDNNGVWRGKAEKDGKSVDVSLDFQGNVVLR
jgi:hypothetical protein